MSASRLGAACVRPWCFLGPRVRRRPWGSVAGAERGGLIQRWRQGAAEAVPVVAASAVLALCLGQLLIHPVVALANNGDFDRLLAMIGLRTTGAPYAAPYAWVHYTVGPTHAPGGSYLTSYLGVAGLMSAIAHLFGGFDTRILATFLALVLAALVYVIVKSLPGQWTRVATGTVLLTGLCDSRVVAYLDSWYDEPWSLLLLLGLTAWLLHNRGARTVSRRGLLVLMVIAILLMTSKVQNVVLAVPIIGTIVILARERDQGSVSRRLGRIVVPSLLLVAVAVGFMAAQSGVYAGENHYDLIFDDLLLRVHDPAATLESLGLPASMKSYVGTNAYGTRTYGRPSGIDTPEFRRFESGDPTTRLGLYYATHPLVAAEEVARGLRAGWKADLPYLGYRTPSSGDRPWAGACEPCAYSTATAAVSAGGVPLTLVVYSGALVLAAMARRRSLPGPADALLCLCAISAVALLAAVFGEGNYEEVKHLYLFYASNIILLAISCGVVAHMTVEWWESRRLSADSGTDSSTPISKLAAVRDRSVWRRRSWRTDKGSSSERPGRRRKHRRPRLPLRSSRHSWAGLTSRSRSR